MDNNKVLKNLKRLEFLGYGFIGLFIYICVMEFIDSSRLYFWRSFFVIVPAIALIYFIQGEIMKGIIWNADKNYLKRVNQAEVERLQNRQNKE